MFIAMWAAMMVAMMLPSSLPILLVYRRTLAFRGEPGLAFALWSLGAAYFAVWTAFGVVAYLGGLGIAAAAMRSEAVARSVPLATGLALVVAGAYQLTPWKSACLRHCRDPLRLIAAHLGGGRRGAVALGLHHGAFCAGCCSGLMVVQLSLGIMSVAAMIAVAAVIAAEKLLPQGLAIARGAGVAAIAAGFFLAGSSVL
jgi:predicted metal-binding membrane protein